MLHSHVVITINKIVLQINESVTSAAEMVTLAKIPIKATPQLKAAWKISKQVDKVLNTIDVAKIEHCN